MFPAFQSYFSDRLEQVKIELRSSNCASLIKCRIQISDLFSHNLDGKQIFGAVTNIKSNILVEDISNNAVSTF